MPRGKKSKHRREKRQQGLSEDTQSLKGAEATAEEIEVPLSSPPNDDSPPSSPAPDPSQEPQGATATSSLEPGFSCPISDASAKSQGEESASASQAAPSALRARRDPLSREVCKVVQFLLGKLSKKEPITQTALLRFVKRKYKKHFPEILRRVFERMDLLFGLDFKDVNPSNHTYAFFNKQGLRVEGDLSSDEVVPKTEFLMVLLGVIFMNGNLATEEEIWKFLRVYGVHPGKKHLVFGEPREFITKDLVEQHYLECRQVPDSNPPRCLFLWGPRSHADIGKMKVLDVLARIYNKLPTAFPNLYDEALRDEEDKAWLRAAAMVGSFSKHRPCSKSRFCTCSHN
ncbi:Melanoma-associated antigen B1 [Myotis brandtii]|uniref:Melanoma-associated antigen B1 n=1 Tax=Myotis brandtii TaxID=109478 RepID=S7P1S4_MYOBR|nr:PREDICTED: melanoma-associated antigen B1 [Myotis brandtii]EPQ04028.1 Melanoma-associated antigen B1 [Myotis brandtii]